MMMKHLCVWCATGLALVSAAVGGAETNRVWKHPTLRFPTQNRYRISNLPQWHGSGFTLEVWVKPEAEECGYTALKKNSFGFPNFFKEGKFSVYVAPSRYPYWIDNPAGPGTWQHLVWSGTPEKIQIYSNGKLLWEKAANGVPPLSSYQLLIGESMGWGKNFQGEIGLVRIYDRNLDGKEIADHFQLLREGKLPPQAGAIWEAGPTPDGKDWRFTP